MKKLVSLKRIVTMLLLIVAMCLWDFNPAGHVDEIVYTVHTGDTIWAVAERYADCQVKSLGEFVFDISERNKLSGKHIYPGDKLVIPLWTRAKGE